MEHMGKIIVLEGLDKSGKTTQAHLLHDYLNDKNPGQTVLFSFPDYSTTIGQEIRSFLDGKVQYNAETKHMLLSANRWEKKESILESLSSGKTIILNRYYQSNLVYGLANGLDFEWLTILDKGMPKEDVTILLDISPRVSYLRSIVNNFILDDFEKNREFLERVRINYLKLAKSFDWNVLHSDNSKDIIFKSILDIIGEH
ncbi:MAG: dTMP kinase [Candidatus Nitrosocosmicus sp.]|nr:dTMP kinase [Candidatus Nitrosocosmicus sp.]